MLSIALLFHLIPLGMSTGKTMQEIERFINKWNWDVKCWGENNVIKQRMTVQRVSEECMKIPMNKNPDFQLPENNMVALHPPPTPGAQAPDKY